MNEAGQSEPQHLFQLYVKYATARYSYLIQLPACVCSFVVLARCEFEDHRGHNTDIFKKLHKWPPGEKHLV